MVVRRGGQGNFGAQVGAVNRVFERRVAVHLRDVVLVHAAGFVPLVAGGNEQFAGADPGFGEILIGRVALVDFLKLGFIAAVQRRLQVGGGKHVEQKDVFVAGHLAGKKAVAAPGIIHATDFFVLGGHGVLQAQQGVHFGVEDGEVGRARAAPAILQIGFDLGHQRPVVGQLALVADDTATHGIVDRAGVDVRPNASAHVRHGVGNVVAHGNRAGVVPHRVQAAAGVAAQRCAQVHMVGRRGVDAVFRQMLVKTLHVAHAPLARLVHRQGHGHAHVDELGRFVINALDPVGNGVFGQVGVQLVVGVFKIALVVDPFLNYRVFRFGIIQHLHKPQLLQLAVQIQHRGAAVAVQILADQGGVQTPGHAVVRPGIKIKAGANELLLQLARGGRGGHGGHRLQHRRRPVHRITQRLRGPLPPLVELGGGERLGVAVALDDGFEHGVF